MKEDLKALIQQHLPAMAAGEMKNYIEQAEKDKTELESLRKEKETLVNKNFEISVENNSLKTTEQSVANKAKELSEKEKVLNEKEFNLKVSELTYQLQAEKDSKNGIFQLVQTFVANPRAIEIISKSRNYTHGTDYNHTGTTHYPMSHYESETREHKEQK